MTHVDHRGDLLLAVTSIPTALYRSVESLPHPYLIRALVDSLLRPSWVDLCLSMGGEG